MSIMPASRVSLAAGAAVALLIAIGCGNSEKTPSVADKTPSVDEDSVAAESVLAAIGKTRRPSCPRCHSITNRVSRSRPLT